MNSKYVFESERLGFRRWKDSDKEAFANMNASETVMRYYPKPLTIEESNAMIQRIEGFMDDNGYGLWAVQLKEKEEFIGYIGFTKATFQADFTPCLEIGWRLDNKFWNKGYATEGAKACLDYAFNILGLREIYSFTAVINTPSSNVMQKIGMEKIGEFEHPGLAIGNKLRPHVLYKITK